MTNSTHLKDTEAFFFEAMICGWASGNDGVPIPNFHHGWREIQFECVSTFVGYRLTDRWGKDPDTGRPSGSTVITYRGVPLWAMWYGGDTYKKPELPLLKRALMENYRAKIFCGGRGPQEYVGEGHTYYNPFKGDFSKFSGDEYIRTNPPVVQVLGGHQYWGGSLLYLK